MKAFIRLQVNLLTSDISHSYFSKWSLSKIKYIHNVNNIGGQCVLCLSNSVWATLCQKQTLTDQELQTGTAVKINAENLTEVSHLWFK